MSPRLPLLQRFPELFTRDSSLTPGRIEIPDDRMGVIELVTALQRELMYARRTADSAMRQLDARPMVWTGAPRYAKLRYRPLVFGSSPTACARSSLPFDDTTGDNLARRWGIPGGFHQLMGLAKLANIYPLPISDMPLDARSEEVRQDLLDAHVAAGLFKDRVVVLIGHEALRAFGYSLGEFAHYAGPLPRSPVPGACEVLAMPDPQYSPLWRTDEGRHVGRLVFVRALLAARLPVPGHPLSPRLQTRYAAEAAAHLAPFPALPSFPTNQMTEVARDCWAQLGAQATVETLVRGPGMDLWRELARYKLATPRDCGSRSWWFDPATSTSVTYFDRGSGRVVGDRWASKVCELLDSAGLAVARCECHERSTGLRFVENEAARRGWTWACFELDRQLAEMRGGRP